MYPGEIYEIKQNIKSIDRLVDGVDKLKQYDVDVEEYILINPKTSYIDGISLDESMKLKQENKTLKDRWQKLKLHLFDRSEFLDDLMDDEPTDYVKGRYCEVNEIYEKLREIEEEKSDG